MDTGAIYHHLTPQTYMRAWKHRKSSVYVVDKGKNDLGQSRNTGKFGGIKHYHSIRAGSLVYSEQDCQDFFQPLEKYTIEIDGEVVNNQLDMNKMFFEFDKWNIRDSSGNIVSEQIKKSLKSSILSIIKKDIEVGWDRKYENYWNSINQDITNGIFLNANSISQNHLMKAIKRDELIKFMVSLEWRTKPYHPELQKALDNTLRNDFLGIDFKLIQIPEGERLYPFLETLYDEYAHSYILKLYREFLAGKGIIMDEAKKFIDESSIVFYIAPKDGEFITSDNPVCRFTNLEGKIEYIFPLNPKVACAVLKGTQKEHYVLSYLSKDKLVYYNKKLKDNCNKGYIIREQNRELYFGDEK
ncbi:DUF4238 domain-containing protein [Bacillus cereus]|uniref:DUF4238 domain-containing protein n=1 Tax=Bacillus TaxID=1386 RepID=UPI002B23FC00|nr:MULTISPECIES: DUF4238 domain-containing protein [Bacillus]MEB2589402.1 DUF4238 domain-containing protein [Bacillus cereus]MEB2640264.1 DUF4238 domain-containing protein [Bacillus sp. DAG6]